MEQKYEFIYLEYGQKVILRFPSNINKLLVVLFKLQYQYTGASPYSYGGFTLKDDCLIFMKLGIVGGAFHLKKEKDYGADEDYPCIVSFFKDCVSAQDAIERAIFFCITDEYHNQCNLESSNRTPGRKEPPFSIEIGKYTIYSNSTTNDPNSLFIIRDKCEGKDIEKENIVNAFDFFFDTTKIKNEFPEKEIEYPGWIAHLCSHSDKCPCKKDLHCYTNKPCFSYSW